MFVLFCKSYNPGSLKGFESPELGQGSGVFGRVVCKLGLRERTDIETETDKLTYSSQYFAPLLRCGLFLHVLLELCLN